MGSLKDIAGMRRSERVFLRLPIQVRGTDADGKPFSEKTCTLVLNKTGARIALKNSPAPDSQLTITNLQTQKNCTFRVVGRTDKSLGEGPEWGVECLEPETNFWGISFPSKSEAKPAEEPVDALLECAGCCSRELAQISLGDYRTLSRQGVLPRNCDKCGRIQDWRYGFIEVQIEDQVLPPTVASAEKPSATAAAEKRQSKRVMLKIPIRIRLPNGAAEMARTENLSKTGLCFVSELNLQQGERVWLAVGSGATGEGTEVLAGVAWKRPLEGQSRTLYGVRIESKAGAS